MSYDAVKASKKLNASVYYTFYRRFSTPFTYLFVNMGLDSATVSMLNFAFPLIGLILFTTISCDQISKKIARENLSVSKISFLGDTVRLQYIENNGAFLNFGADWPAPLKILLFSVLPFGVLAYLFIFLLKSGKMNTTNFIALS